MDYYRSHWVSIEPERLARYDQLLQWMPRWRGSWKVSSCRRTAGNRLRLWPGLGGAGACAAGAGGGVGEGGVGEGRGRGAGARSKGPGAGGRAPRSRRGVAGGVGGGGGGGGGERGGGAKAGGEGLEREARVRSLGVGLLGPEGGSLEERGFG